MKYTILILLFLSVNLFSYGQSKKISNDETVKQIRKDVSKPSVYIDFKSLDRSKSISANDLNDKVYLTLNNNSIWSIYVRVFVYGKDEKTGLYYQIEREDNSISNTEVPEGHKRGDFGSPDSEMKSGTFINFTVPRNHLKDNLKIRINFTYEWERELNNSSYSNPQHSVFFSSSDLVQFLHE